MRPFFVYAEVKNNTDNKQEICHFIPKDDYSCLYV